MYHHSLFLILITLVISCTHQSKINKPTADIENTLEVLAPLSISPSILDSVKKYAPIRKDIYEVNDNTFINLKKITPELVEYALLGRVIENWDGYYLKLDESIDYYFFDRSETGKATLFTVLQRCENGYDHYFLYVYNNELEKITSLVWIGSAGGHAGENVKSKWLYYSYGNQLQSEIYYEGLTNEKKVFNFQFYNAIATFPTPE